MVASIWAFIHNSCVCTVFHPILVCVHMSKCVIKMCLQHISVKWLGEALTAQKAAVKFAVVSIYTTRHSDCRLDVLLLGRHTEHQVQQQSQYVGVSRPTEAL